VLKEALTFFSDIKLKQMLTYKNQKPLAEIYLANGFIEINF